MFIDSHAHLQWSSFKNDLNDVINKAAEEGVKRILNVGFDIDGSQKAIELANKYQDLYAAVGIHPHEAKNFNDNILDELKQLSDDKKVVAIGEAGLDYYRNLSSVEAQQKTFIAQLELSAESDLPIIVHNRDAEADILNLLSRFKGKVRGVMHCFSGSYEMAKKCIELDFYVSFAGSITYPNSHKLRDVAKRLELDRMLLETDCPWLTPQPVRGKRNEPAFLIFTAKEIAKLKNISTEKLAEITTANANSLFSFH
jgi:TatD DNase family protein